MLYILMLVPVSFGALIVIFQIMRSLRQHVENTRRLESKRAQAFSAPALAARTPSDDFHDQIWLPLCQRVAELATRQMNRPLTHDERHVIWRSRSQLVLELLLKELADASPGAAMALLKNAPSGLDRPDPTGWCEREN